ncbi:MAG: cytidine deaminase [Proteobacteria bacterium]|nr:cytidine deaminase [Pseudomonadota bacterium]NBY19134.1 cytidine deaminase [bacterium]
MKKELPVSKLNSKEKDLVKKAINAKKKAYAPYSKYQVGSVVLDDTGKIYTGCNVENASYPAGLCAERTAIVKMVSEGGKKIKTIVVAASSEEPVFPCGMCLQVIQEFGADSEVIALNKSGKHFLKALTRTLFPFAFDPEKLNQ